MSRYNEGHAVATQERVGIETRTTWVGGNCGNDDGSVRLESEMLPRARDGCPNP